MSSRNPSGKTANNSVVWISIYQKASDGQHCAQKYQLLHLSKLFQPQITDHKYMYMLRTFKPQNEWCLNFRNECSYCVETCSAYILLRRTAVCRIMKGASARLHLLFCTFSIRYNWGFFLYIFNTLLLLFCTFSIRYNCCFVNF